MSTAEPVRARPVAFAGRDDELARLRAELEAAVEARSFRAVFVRGPAGVGRTALLGAFASRLADAHVAVLAARTNRLGGAAFGLVAPVARAALELIRPSVPATSVATFENSLAPLFGETAPEGQTPVELAGAFADLVFAAGRDRPLLVALDDVDAADPASLGLVSYLLGALLVPDAVRALDQPSGGGLVLLSLREETPPPLLAELLARVPGLSLPVAPFDLEQVRGWLARQGAERFFEVTGGVPAKLAELVDPGTTIDLAARRLERLTEADRAVLAALAVLAQPSDAALVAEVSGRKDASARLAQLERARLVEAAPGTGRTLYSCARAADRDAAIAALSPIARRDLETQAARALEVAGEVEAAFALYRSAGDARATSVGVTAAERLSSRGALDAARGVLEQVLARADGRARSSALILLAGIAERQGDGKAALAAWGRARALAEPWRQREIRARCARLCLDLGAPRPAERLARAVLAAGPADAAASEATVALAEARFLGGAYAEALSITESAVAPPYRLALANTRGKALLTLGRLDEAQQAFRTNAETALAAGDSAERTRALLNAGVVAHRQGRRAEAKSAYRAALLEGASSLRAVVHANLAALALEEGEAEEALSQAHRALAAFSRAGQRKQQAHAAQNLARVYLYLGDLARAGELARHASDLARHVGDPYLAAGAALVEAEARFAKGEEKAAEAFAESAARFAALQNPRYEQESLLLLADAELARGHAPQARAALERARAAGALSIPALAAESHLLEAELAIASADEPLAAQALSAARRALLEAPQLELPAWLYFLSGALADKRGQPERAQAERLKAAHLVEGLAAKVPPERRSLFYARRRRRAILDAAGRGFAEAQRLSPARPASRRGAALPTLVGETAAIERINALIVRFGPSPATVLVRGESGTGKELVARALHENSPRRSLPLVAVNCGALNEELLLSELFGHEKGAFTGAVKERKGRFELADGGTIFLDEIGDISPRAQVALLRVLQERSFERVGGSRTLSVDVRVVCATNRDLEALMARGAFREDLYYRLRGATLHLPSLRERIADLPLLCAHQLAKVSAAKGEEPRTLSAEALKLLARYPWPGNVRELFNVLDTALLFATGPTLGPEAFELFPELFAERVAAPLPASAPGSGSGPELDFFEVLTGRGCSLTDLHREVDRACMEGAMQKSGGVISEAARTLGMTRSRLSQLLHQEPSQRGWRRSAAVDDEPDELASNLQNGTGVRGGSR